MPCPLNGLVCTKYEGGMISGLEIQAMIYPVTLPLMYQSIYVQCCIIANTTRNFALSRA